MGDSGEGEGTAGFGAGAAGRGASRASRGGPGRLWPPRDARDVRGSVMCDGRPTRSRTSVTVLHESEARDARSLTKIPGTSHLPAPGGGRKERYRRVSRVEAPIGGSTLET